jgi:HAE1 family hydrophobic/amphiphilic exporter-1
MNLPQLSIKEYVFAFMINAVLVLFGIIGYQRIGVDRFPHIEFPVVSVTTTLPGANPDIVDSSITNILESSVNSIPGIDFVQSTSTPGVSVVALQFELDKDIDVAFNEVQAKVNQVLRDLPDESDPPVVAKVEVGASPVMWLALRVTEPCNNSTSTPGTSSRSASRQSMAWAKSVWAVSANAPSGWSLTSTG